MKRLIAIAMLLLANRQSHAQAPVEVMAGHQQTLYLGYVNKDLDSAARWNVFAQSLFALNYRDKNYNSVSIDGQLTYMLTSWLGISAGGGYDGERFNPAIGLSLNYMNRKKDLLITAYPTVQLARPRSFDMFALINYCPNFSSTWGLFTQFILGTNLGLQKQYPGQPRQVLNFFTQHNGSTQLIRIGLNYKKRFQFGLGADLVQFGQGQGSFTNYGIFFRVE